VPATLAGFPTWTQADWNSVRLPAVLPRAGLRRYGNGEPAEGPRWRVRAARTRWGSDPQPQGCCPAARTSMPSIPRPSPPEQPLPPPRLWWTPDRAAAEEQGTWPETIACVLWGTDNIKTYGESLAQILWFIGARPVPDSLGRVNKLELIPLEELGRPRVDVVVNCSGVFRDLFINQMALIDQGVKMAAEADEPLEMNFVRKHAQEQAEKEGISLRDAATECSRTPAAATAPTSTWRWRTAPGKRRTNCRRCTSPVRPSPSTPITPAR
jgi:hypothetical protein